MHYNVVIRPLWKRETPLFAVTAQPGPRMESKVDRTACGSGPGRRRVLRNGPRHIHEDVASPFSIPGVLRTDLDDRPRIARADQVNVVGAGMISSHRDSGTVLAFVNRVITDERKQPNYEGSRLKVDYRKIDGKWLIDEMTPIF